MCFPAIGYHLWKMLLRGLPTEAWRAAVVLPEERPRRGPGLHALWYLVWDLILSGEVTVVDFIK